MNTVARAYRELEEVGLIETRGRSGSFVVAAGHRSRDQAREAAQQYVRLALRLGLEPDEALAMLRAALESSAAVPG